MPLMKTFKAGSEFIHKVFLSAQKETLQEMGAQGKFNVIWDTGASISITPNREDFIEFNDNVENSYLEGVSKDFKVKGEGTVQWNMIDVNGNIRKLKLRALYVPSCNLRLLRPHAVTDMYPDETLSIVEKGILLSGALEDSSRGPIMAELSSTNHLPFTTCFSNHGLVKAGTALNATITEVHESNLNLTAAEKFYLQWHWRLGHPSFNKLMHLFRSGVLSCTESARRKISAVLSNVKSVPKCAGCMFGKQQRLPTPGTNLGYQKQPR